MSTATERKIYFLENGQGQAVRAVEWDSNELNFIYRHDTRRMETTSNLKALEKAGVPFTLLESVDKKFFNLKQRYPIRSLTGELSLVAEAIETMPNVELIEDDTEKFKTILKKTAFSAAIMALLLMGVSYFATSTAPAKEELQIVQVLDRKQIEKPVVVPPRVQPVAKAPRIVTPAKTIQKPTRVVKTQFIKTKKKVPQVSQMGTLGVLGSLKSSKQKGGLQINQAETSAGVGRGGSQGSGGIQTSVYSKGMFAAPLGSGNRADGAGGYGTKGKGGGRAGYGKVTLVGSSNSFFEPIESEAWTEGGLDRNAIAAVIYRHLSEVRFCYEQGLQKKPNLSGRVSMNFIIGPKGFVTTAQVNNSSLSHAPVENCIRDRLKTWKFPQPQGGVNVKVNYPFVLRRVSDS
ncbi:MAG: AgmX/PglI C-terminal domain-containing protein [Bdellovibrionaceae bacterium]|nr:AgmX/PglI C-terminal domain-containing protein [Pseudobdellovibrionaceae bacterium]